MIFKLCLIIFSNYSVHFKFIEKILRLAVFNIHFITQLLKYGENSKILQNVIKLFIKSQYVLEVLILLKINEYRNKINNS